MAKPKRLKFRARYPAMFTDAMGTVHPIRSSPGYDVLEDRAAAVTRKRDAKSREVESFKPRLKLDAIGEWEAIRRALPFGISRSQTTPRAESRLRGARVKHTYDREDIPGGLYRVNGIGPDLVGERLIHVLGERAAKWDADQALDYLRGARRRYLEAIGVVGEGGVNRARAARRQLGQR